MRTLVLTAVIGVSIAASGVEQPKTATSPAARRAAAAEKAGGRIAVPNSQKGTISIVNAQQAVPQGEIENAIAIISKADEYNFKIEAADPGADPVSAVRNSKSPVTVAVVANDSTPALLVSPDEGWAVVNVNKLDAGLNTPAAKEKFLPSRFRKQFIRAFVLACTGTGSQYKQNFFWAKSIQDLDLYREFIPQDSANNCKERLADKGVTPLKYTVYIRACHEGWAPQPTNDVQKAIWDKVHAMPTEPIKIKPEEKKTER